MKQKLIVILGPTATGKSDLAVELAKKYNGEIISADSRQVYTGLDIGSGKITKKEMRGVPHHLLDVVKPQTTFSVARFKKLAEKAIRDISSRGKIPIIAGGTGFYIDSIVHNIDTPSVGPNKKLRKELEGKPLVKLQITLKKLDPRRFKTIDTQNKVRVIRSIEIARTLGKVPVQKESESPFHTLLIGLDWSDTVLRKRIHDRLLKRERGMIREAKRLHTEGLSWKRMMELGLEYRYLALYLTGKISKEEMIEQLEPKIWQYAKRQRTWFRRNKDITWFRPTALKSIDKKVAGFLK